jgi:uncharacterized Fe-S cluster protein YjdI
VSQPTRTYTNGQITVEWRPELCIHCEKCFRGLPSVFDPNKRPWVNMSGATTDQITKQVSECPSAALAIGT